MDGMSMKIFDRVGSRSVWVFDVDHQANVLYRKGVKCSDEECDRYAEGLQIGSWDDELVPTMDVSPVCVTHKYTDDLDTTSGLVFIKFPHGHDAYTELFR